MTSLSDAGLFMNLLGQRTSVCRMIRERAGYREGERMPPERIAEIVRELAPRAAEYGQTKTGSLEAAFRGFLDAATAGLPGALDILDILNEVAIPSRKSPARPSISGKVKNVFHLANRAAKAMREAGVDLPTIEDMKARILNQNTRFTTGEALEIVREYCEVTE